MARPVRRAAGVGNGDRCWMVAGFYTRGKGSGGQGRVHGVPHLSIPGSHLLLTYPLVSLLSPASVVTCQSPDHWARPGGTQVRDPSSRTFCKEKVLVNFGPASALSEAIKLYLDLC